MDEARQYLERALREPPADLRVWVWSLVPLGKRVLVAAASAVMAPAIDAWRVTVQRDPQFGRYVGDDLVLVRARDAVQESLRLPSDDTAAQLRATATELASFVSRVRFLANEVSGDGNLHAQAVALADCIALAVRAALWSEDDARRAADGDAAEEASRIAAGPAYEAAEAITTYAQQCPQFKGAVVDWISQACLRAL